MVSENKIQLKRIGKPPQQSNQKKSLVEQVSVKTLKYKIQRNTCACFSKAKNKTGKERRYKKCIASHNIGIAPCLQYIRQTI